MKVKPNSLIQGFGKYAFAEVDELVEKLKARGIEPVDFGVGDPQKATPEIIRNTCKEAIDNRKASGYPSYAGEKTYREEIAAWTKRRFGISLNSETEICASIGSKEAIFNFPNAFIEHGDYVLVPNPGYPPYERGTLFAQGNVYFMNLLPENNFLPDLNAIPKDVAQKAKIIWVNYPNNPTTALASKEFYKELIDFARENNIIVASDEPYTENYYAEKPISILNVAREGVVVFQSLSKRSNMTCYRVGWVAGDEEIIAPFKKLKTSIDSGTPTFIQDAAIAALGDETHVEQLRREYQEKRELIVNAFENAGLERSEPQGTIYVWQRIPERMSSVEFAKILLKPEIALVVTPGEWISSEAGGTNPGENYIRLALVPTIEECKTAAERIGKIKV